MSRITEINSALNRLTVAAARYADAAYAFRISRKADIRARQYRNYVKPHDLDAVTAWFEESRREYRIARYHFQAIVDAAVCDYVE